VASSKRCYLAPHPPSSSASELSHNLPADVLGRVLGDDDVAAGRDHFAVVGCMIRELDLLVVAPEGHRRAQYAFDDGGLTSSTWLHPCRRRSGRASARAGLAGGTLRVRCHRTLLLSASPSPCTLPVHRTGPSLRPK
jgi:hypothetical protein